jgi:hypothetical protein
MTTEVVSGGDDICDYIEFVVDEAETLVEETTQEAAQGHLEDLQSAAAAHPRWQNIAGDISMWGDQDTGNITFGVHPSSPRANEARLAEYGDEHNAPAPLVRMGLMSNVVDMGWSMQEAFQRAGFG